jgi:type III pantothenate kinase
MDLLIDTGNSSIKWARLESGVLGSMESVLHEGFENPAGLFDSIWGKIPTPNRVLVSNVAGEQFSAAFKSWAKVAWGCSVILAQPQLGACGVVNGYTEAEKLGVDRWLALIGVRSLTQEAVIIVDAGTAITVDAMNNQGQHLGGVIAPGLVMMQASLIKETSGIELETQAEQFQCPANNTEQAIFSGAHNAVVGMINQTMDLLQEKMEMPVQFFITGGDAKCLLPVLVNQYQYESALVLQGLAKAAGETQ